jgi:hypothetical protein
MAQGAFAMIENDGFILFQVDNRVCAWVKAAKPLAHRIASDPVARTANLRHGKTWFVGVDALPNASDGSVDGVPLAGPWLPLVPELPLHRAQLSIIYPGYPRQDLDESDANYRYRNTRSAAHVDGLLPEGPKRRRYAREFHAYVLGVPLKDARQAPTVVWRGSHRIMQNALRAAIGSAHIGSVDVTDAYHAARRRVFETCEKVLLTATLGQSYLIHRFAVHGTEPWQGPAASGRMVAFFRPEFANPADWLGE